MGRRVVLALYLLIMVAILVTLDLLVLRHHVWERLTVNLAIVAVFVAFYWALLRRL